MAAGLSTLKVFDQGSLPKMAAPADDAGRSESDWYWRPLLILTGLLVFSGVMATAFNKVYGWINQPVRNVLVEGETHYLDKIELASALATGINSQLLSQSLVGLQELAMENPWVRSVQIRREWPPAISVKVTEQVPVARWGNKGLLNQQGDIFWPKDERSYDELPLLSGPATETQRLMAKYHELSRLFQESSVKMTGLTMEARGAWTIWLDNGIEVIVGREQMKARLLRFLHLYKTELEHQAKNIERVDIRYTNGAAVKWRPQEEEKAGQTDGRS